MPRLTKNDGLSRQYGTMWLVLESLLLIERSLGRWALAAQGPPVQGRHHLDPLDLPVLDPLHQSSCQYVCQGEQYQQAFHLHILSPLSILV